MMNDDGHGRFRAIPEHEDTGHKEVYAFFGLCSYYAQVLEQGVMNLAVGLHIRQLTALNSDDIATAFERADRKTLGQLLYDVRKTIEVSLETEAALEKALEDRNYLFHRFFVKHDVDFASDPGRREMIAELQLLTTRFQDADKFVDAICIPLWERLGLTDDVMAVELQRMQAEADQKQRHG